MSSISEGVVVGTAAPPLEPAVAERRDPIFKVNALLHVVALALLAGFVVGLWMLFAHGGWEYYRTPVNVRGYSPFHSFLRPSGPGGNLVGIAGTLVMILTLLYVARKKVKALSRIGTMKGWLEFHIFCGIFGPILVTFHTSFKFNGIISVAYWSMILVVLSGFVGRYLFVRIPKTIRGEELSKAEIEERARDLKRQLLDGSIPAELLGRMEEVENEVTLATTHDRGFLPLLLDGAKGRWTLARFRREIRASGLDRRALHDALDTVHERAVLLRRISRLQQTKRLFEMWHVFHKPLVWVLFLVFTVHLGVAVYFGYTIVGK